ncbi:2-oxoglutarate-dependent dioxygenase 11-like [Hordeum vulgare subsp. vulgare]|uniref:Non-haem dioxygenase N-terminal domain-containing protein n=1 Tax=Hordeum vulgare subsp. vulgare TaxID=112509 RepID=A0A287M4U9_HORVV|nr:2-oxoglutarate-dependent dioxygenase 11-like [Hordeum vulgare subsp. vulgare]
MVHQAHGLLVQEVAADGELPSRYVLKEQQGRPAAAADAQRAAPSIPTVDMGRLADADAGEADKLRSALASWGLFAVTGHGMTDPFLDAMLGAARGFFHLPTEAKQEYSNVVDADDGGRKFQPEGYDVDRVDTDEQVLDWCDRLYLQVRPDDARQLRFWPTHPSDLAELLKEFSVEGEKVAKLGRPPGGGWDREGRGSSSRRIAPAARAAALNRSRFR